MAGGNSCWCNCCIHLQKANFNFAYTEYLLITEIILTFVA